MLTIEQIQENNRQRSENLMLNFKEVDTDLVKGISEDDFNAKYPTEKFDVYSALQLAAYGNDLKKAIENDLEAKETILEKAKQDTLGLNKVIVNKESGKEVYFVKAKIEA